MIVIHFNNGTLRSKYIFSQFFSPELMFVLSIQIKQAS